MNKEYIKITKNFSVEEAANFREMTYKIISKGSVEFHLDFSECVFIDSTGLGILVSLYKKCKENNSEMILSHITGDVKSFSYDTIR